MIYNIIQRHLYSSLEMKLNGVEQEVIDKCDQSIEIPQYGTKHSFNVSVSGGIILDD